MNLRLINIFFFLILLTVWQIGQAAAAWAQTPADSVRTVQTLVDSSGVAADSSATPVFESKADSIRYHIKQIQSQLVGSDSTSKIQKVAGKTVEIVDYQADSIYYEVDAKILKMQGNVGIRYQDLKLNAGRVNYFARRELLVAENDPVLFEGPDKIVGTRMAYNIRTREGQIDGGRSQFEDGFYYGDRINKLDENTLLVRDGFYTTCDLEEPHYCFRSKRMKVVLKDKVIARPVVLYFGPVPVLAMPFYIFPIRTGRQSGFLTPKIGDNNTDGRYIENLGYYWATNEYMDLTGRISIRERTGLEVGADYVYVWRHHLDGRLTVDYDWKIDSQDQSSTRWRLVGAHNQILGENFRLNANANFVSSKEYYKDTSDDQDERTEGLLRSNLLLDKSWGQSRAKFASSYTHNLITDTKTAKLPEMTFNYSRPNFLKFRRGSWLDRWSPSLSFSSRSSFDQTLTTRPYGYEDVQPDTTITREKNVTTTDWSALQSFSLSFSVKPQTFYWLNLSLSTSLSDQWKKDHEEAVDDSANVYTQEKRADNSHRLTPGNLSLNANTAIYGIVQPRLGRLEAMRHTIRPSVSMSYRPGFYFEDADYGLDLEKKSQNLNSKFSVNSIRLANVFEAKVREDSTRTRNIQLFTMDFSSSYTKSNDEWRFSDIQGSLNTRISAISVNASTSYDPYDREFGTGTVSTNITGKLSERKVRGWFNSLLGREPEPQPRASVVDTTFQQQAALDTTQADSLVALSEPAVADTLGLQPTTPDSLPGDTQLGSRRQPTPAGGMGESRWDLSLTHSYRRTFELSDREDTVDRPPTSNLTATLKLRLTKNWDVTYRNYYNLTDKKTRTQTLDVKRDLHCWQASFSWTSRENGTWNYYFIVSIKKLPDVKVEHKESRR